MDASCSTTTSTSPTSCAPELVCNQNTPETRVTVARGSWHGREGRLDGGQLVPVLPWLLFSQVNIRGRGRGCRDRFFVEAGFLVTSCQLPPTVNTVTK